MRFLALLFISSLSFATNGGHLIGVSPASGAMGGTGVAHFSTATDASYKNPALLSSLPGNVGAISAELYGTLIKQNSTAEASSGASTAGEKTSTAPARFMPALSLSYKACENFGTALSMFVFSGANSDYNGNAEINQILADTGTARLALSGAYKPIPELSIGVSPFLTYSQIQLQAAIATLGETTRSGPDASKATGFGLLTGVTVYPTEGLTLGLTYQTKSNYKYTNVIDLVKFGGTAFGTNSDINAGEPSEFAAALAYEISNWTFAFDYRMIGWSSADGTKNLGWKDQSVFGLGAQYKMDAWAFRAGFNYGKSPIEDVSGEVASNTVTIEGVPVSVQSISILDTVAFPGVTQTHITFGAGYDISPAFTLDLGVELALKKTVTRTGTGVSPLTGGAGAYGYTANVSQWTVQLGGAYHF